MDDAEDVVTLIVNGSDVGTVCRVWDQRRPDEFLESWVIYADQINFDTLGDAFDYLVEKHRKAL